LRPPHQNRTMICRISELIGLRAKKMSIEYKLRSNGKTKCENLDCGRTILLNEEYVVVEFKNITIKLCKKCAS